MTTDQSKKQTWTPGAVIFVILVVVGALLAFDYIYTEVKMNQAVKQLDSIFKR